MVVEISTKAKSILSLCEDKDKLQEEAKEMNEEIQSLIAEFNAKCQALNVEFNTKMRVASRRQEVILDLMSGIDEAIEKISRSF